jgi:formylglycine-generating enzyme required for sulfatase activity
MPAPGTVVANDPVDVFVSYSRADWRHAAEIDSVLRSKGLKCFFDRRELTPGLPWIRALEEAISAAKAVIVLIGPQGLGNTQQYERELAIVRQSHDPAFPVVPVILPETTTDRPFDFLNVLTWVDFSRVAKVSDAPEELTRLLTAVRGAPLPGEAAQEAICPYRGLNAFREEDAAFFFGRGSASEPDSPVGQLLRKVHDQPFVMVVGRSGGGKSSLVFAGLLPALRRESDHFWNVLSLRPGPAPLRALAAAFNPRASNEGAAEYATKITDEAEKLRTGDPELLSHMIHEELDRAEGKPDRLLLYIDQWEELYTQAQSGGDKHRAGQHAADVTRFIDLLLTASSISPVTVVGTVRADFFDPLIAHQKIRLLLPAQQVLLGSMPRSDLERTIVEPARKVGLKFDPPGLVQRILDEVGEDEGMLPLVQYALKETWALREGDLMTAASYARSGGVQGAIRITAERTFDALSAQDQQTARRLFLRLVTPGEGQEDTRARAPMPAELTQQKIIEQFAGPRTRLLVTGSDAAQRPTIEVCHEALIRTWPRLRGWIDANREKLRARAAVLQAKAEWEQNLRRQDLLLPAGFQLERARSLLADPGDMPTDDITEFISLSSAREERQQKKARRVRALTYVTLASIIAGLFSWINQLYIKDEINWWWFGRPYKLTHFQPLSSDEERAKKPGDQFRECKGKDKDDCPEMVVIPAGEFMMGSPKTEQGHDPNENPQHNVKIAKPFGVSKYDVTFAEWDACFSVGGCLRWPNDYGWGRDKQPVIDVSWNDAKAYVAWLSKMTGKEYRLLTEAEWEYAARAGTTTAYSWGDEIGINNTNCNGCGGDFGGKQSMPVGSFAPNAFGLYDMFGNVWDWVEDCFHNNYEGAPTDGSVWGETVPVASFAPPKLYDMFRNVWDWVEDYFHNSYEGVPTDGSAGTARVCNDRVVRSGSWDDQPTDVRAADRYRYSAGTVDSHVGFRVARTLSP